MDRSDWLWGLFAEPTSRTCRSSTALDGDDGLDGYVVFTQKPSTPVGLRRSRSEEFAARDPLAAITLWRFLGGHRMQVEHITVQVAPVDSLLLVLPEQDVESLGNNRWMHRIVDAPGAIAARGFPPDVAAEVHLDLHDRLAPWNEGRWVLRIDGGRGELVPGGTGQLHSDDQRLQRAVHRLGVGDGAHRGRRAPPRDRRRPRARSTPPSPAPPRR